MISRRQFLKTAGLCGLAMTGPSFLWKPEARAQVMNAINYSPPGTRVTVSAQIGPDGMVTIAVADEGPGISPQHLPRLFERFYRIDQARSRKMGGTGLGLVIVKHIALVHGGRAEVERSSASGYTSRLVMTSVTS